MGCSSCSTSSTKDTTGAKTGGGCNNTTGCSTGGCNKLNTFDWLSDMSLPTENRFNIVEVRFKNGRKEFYRNTKNLDLTTGDSIVVDAGSGIHIGTVSLQGEIVRLQMLKKKIKETDASILDILRIASHQENDKFRDIQERNMPTMFRARQVIQELKLDMKLSDVEYQFDNTKATFYYSAENRIDFRLLIKMLASEFKVRIEMRQISLRQEAGRLGGIGVCGRELCCSTWLSDFKNVSASAGRYQNLSLNPAKLSGQCGRLKCCLNYELETYMEALKEIPQVEARLKTRQGDVFLRKTDIFKKIMWFGYEFDNNWIPLTVEQTKEMIKLNKNGTFPESLSNLAHITASEHAEIAKIKVPLNSDLTRLDQKFREKQQTKKKPFNNKTTTNNKTTNNNINKPKNDFKNDLKKEVKPVVKTVIKPTDPTLVGDVTNNLTNNVVNNVTGNDINKKPKRKRYRKPKNLPPKTE